MLKIHSVAIECCAEVGRIAEVVARRDGALADQLRRAMASVALNISEGSGSQGKNRNARYFNALGSAREVGTALEVARAFGYVREIDAQLADWLDRIRATLWRVTHR
jgi:four helix bundle protein